MSLLLPKDPKIARARGFSSLGAWHPLHLAILTITLGLVAFKTYGFFTGVDTVPLDPYILPGLVVVLAGELAFVAYSRGLITGMILALDRLGNADAIAGCYTGEALTSMVEREVNRASRAGRALAILMIDVAADDDGKGAGAAQSENIRQMTRVIREATRNSDVLGQFEPGELALILSDTPTQHASIVIDKLRRRFDVAVIGADASRLSVKLVTARQAADGTGIIWRFDEPIEAETTSAAG
jgi:diguanylate cyclase (GGDEF)-like protein